MSNKFNALDALNQKRPLDLVVGEGYQVQDFMVTVPTDTKNTVLALSPAGNRKYRALIFGALIDCALRLRSHDASERQLAKSQLSAIRQLVPKFSSRESTYKALAFLDKIESQKIGINELVLQANRDCLESDVEHANKLNLLLEDLALEMINIGFRFQDHFNTLNRYVHENISKDIDLVSFAFRLHYNNSLNDLEPHKNEPRIFLHGGYRNTLLILNHETLAAMEEEKKERSVFVDPELCDEKPLEKIKQLKERPHDSRTSRSRWIPSPWKISSWNPFAHLIDTERYQSSRLIRSTFFERLGDTFTALHGRILDNDVKISLLDILIFTAPLRILNNYMNSNSIFGRTFVKILSVLASLTKLLMATALTIALSPIVLLVHLPLSLVNYLVFKKASKMKAKKINQEHLKEAFCIHDHGKSYSSEQIAARQDLASADQPLGKIIDECLSNAKPNETFVIEPFYQDGNDKDSPYIKWNFEQETAPDAANGSTKLIRLALCRHVQSGGLFSDHHSTVVAMIDVTPENQSGIEALLKVNLFGTTTRLLSRHTLDEVELQSGMRNKTKSVYPNQ